MQVRQVIIIPTISIRGIMRDPLMDYQRHTRTRKWWNRRTATLPSLVSFSQFWMFKILQNFEKNDEISKFELKLFFKIEEKIQKPVNLKEI